MVSHVVNAAQPLMRAVAPAAQAGPGGVPLPILIGAGVFGAAVVGLFGFAAYKGIQWLRHGSSVEDVQRGYTNRYDHNRDGVIQLDLYSREYQRVEWHRYTDQHGDHSHSEWRVRVYDATRLFGAADVDRDGRVTDEELQAKIRTYDEDDNGRLVRGEYFRFERELGEVEVYSDPWRDPWGRGPYGGDWDGRDPYYGPYGSTALGPTGAELPPPVVVEADGEPSGS